jgi:hypothetical protein
MKEHSRTWAGGSVATTVNSGVVNTPHFITLTDNVHGALQKLWPNILCQ